MVVVVVVVEVKIGVWWYHTYYLINKTFKTASHYKLYHTHTPNIHHIYKSTTMPTIQSPSILHRHTHTNPHDNKIGES